MQDLHIKAATPQDLELISVLASQIWPVHYIPIIGKAQVDYMLDRMYSLQSLSEQMSKQHRFYLVLLGHQPVGFISVHQEEKEGHWFLNKFYILPQEAAKGLGTKALEAIKKMIRPKKITLTVNRQNYKSINFYFKNHFKINRVADFDIGSGYVMNDFVMEWEDPD